MKKLNIEYMITLAGVILSIISVIAINNYMTKKIYKYEPIKVKEVSDTNKVIAEEEKATSTTTTTTMPTTTKVIQMGSEVVFDNLNKEELINRLNNNLYDTLEGTGEYFANYTVATGLDPYLAVSIVNLETGCKWGCSGLVKTNYNIGGLKGNGSYLKFSSLEEGIDGFLDILYNRYWSKGLTTAETMNPTYATSTEWATKVNNYYNAIKNS